ncbi:hypothetical protein VP1G_10485 [Cytospora mali]|uniref:Uncharacterized protein n=1 Tax=Cytospora mali TaxID=578113 RepID=A0A194UMD3_CYTMA|nr:hypothetical protein VP1G_10485 [Valsa mali var. pyri (nom. inval.)]
MVPALPVVYAHGLWPHSLIEARDVTVQVQLVQAMLYGEFRGGVRVHTVTDNGVATHDFRLSVLPTRVRMRAQGLDEWFGHEYPCAADGEDPIVVDVPLVLAQRAHIPRVLGIIPLEHAQDGVHIEEEGVVVNHRNPLRLLLQSAAQPAQQRHVSLTPARLRFDKEEVANTRLPVHLLEVAQSVRHALEERRDAEGELGGIRRTFSGRDLEGYGGWRGARNVGIEIAEVEVGGVDMMGRELGQGDGELLLERRRQQDAIALSRADGGRILAELGVLGGARSALRIWRRSCRRLFLDLDIQCRDLDLGTEVWNAEQLDPRPIVLGCLLLFCGWFPVTTTKKSACIRTARS